MATRNQGSKSIDRPEVQDGGTIRKPLGGRRMRWMLIKGPEPLGDNYVSDPRGGKGPAWTYDKKEAQQLCPPGYRIVDADEWTAKFNTRQAEKREAVTVRGIAITKGGAA